MHKSNVSNFKENKCIYTSETIDKKLNENIISNIHEQYGKQIDDVVEVLGVTISREELESKLKDFESVNPEAELNNLMMKKETTEIERIVEENEDRFDVDSILDKISKHGMSKITQEELDFLKNQSNK
jgi:hypothetical protein